MPPIPSVIARFIRENHVLSLATILDERPWAASCFYAFDEERARLIVLTEPSTRHGLAMHANQEVAGTIAGQPQVITDIQGIQFRAHASLLSNGAATDARQLYCERHPAARLKPAPVWQLLLAELKFTDNSLVFGRKTLWQREMESDS